MASTEYGLFNDEGCVERGFWSATQAAEGLSGYDQDDELEVRALCGEHDEQPADSCEECNTEEEEEEE